MLKLTTDYMEETKPQIFKVQLSIASSDGQETILIYNEDKSVMHEQAATKEVVALMQDNLKMYLWGKVHPAGKLELFGAAPEQPW